MSADPFAAPAWWPDPTGRYQRRWWMGKRWTGHVDDRGARVYDMVGLPPGWHPDPFGRHELRFWDGQRWTRHVADPGST